mmetsp:Transcript_13945/g.40258  ORF Transcript_13945/g.40258 Transcript_13945/m.40258 type:complete len:92 (+) Transcript_13945:400-675(+)
MGIRGCASVVGDSGIVGLPGHGATLGRTSTEATRTGLARAAPAPGAVEEERNTARGKDFTALGLIIAAECGEAKGCGEARGVRSRVPPVDT